MLPARDKARSSLRNRKSGQDEKAVEDEIEIEIEVNADGEKQVDDSFDKPESRGKRDTPSATSNRGDNDSRFYKDFAVLPAPVDSILESNDSNTPLRYRKLPAKLAEMLARSEYSSIIAWMPHGRSWRMQNASGFVEQVIPVFFDQQHFKSFTRLVNAWGFRRIEMGPDRNSYYHELFLKGRPDLHRGMRRRGTKHKLDVIEEPNFANYPPLTSTPLPNRRYERSLLNTRGRSAAGLDDSGNTEAAAWPTLSTSALFGNNQDALIQSQWWNNYDLLPSHLAIADPSHLRSVERERQASKYREVTRSLFLLGNRSMPSLQPVYQPESVLSLQSPAAATSRLLALQQQQQGQGQMETGQQIMYRRALEQDRREGLVKEQLRLQDQERQHAPSVQSLQSSAAGSRFVAQQQHQARIEAGMIETGQQIMYRRGLEVQVAQDRRAGLLQEQLRRQQRELTLHAAPGAASVALDTRRSPASFPPQQERSWLAPLVVPPPSAASPAWHHGEGVPVPQRQLSAPHVSLHWSLDNPDASAALKTRMGKLAKLSPK